MCKNLSLPLNIQNPSTDSFSLSARSSNTWRARDPQPEVQENPSPHSQPGSSLGAASNPGEEERIELVGVGVIPRRPHYLSPKLKVSREVSLKGQTLIKKNKKKNTFLYRTS